MRILRRSDFKTMPWKNGGGETTEIAVSPDGASMDHFDWRISMARVASDGPFSIFPNIERSLTVLDGHGITLQIADHGEVHLTPDSEPLVFPGDVATMGHLVQGPILDLNVMTRRGVCHATVHVVQTGSHRLTPQDGTAAFLVRGGTAKGVGVHLADGDGLLLETGDEPISLQMSEGARGYAVDIRPASA